MAKTLGGGFLDQIKAKLDAPSGGNFGNVFGVKDGDKKRIRFFTDAPDGIEVKLHSRWVDDGNGTNTCELQCPCLAHFGRPCPYCDDDTVDTVPHFAFIVWNYEEKKFVIFFYKVSKKSLLAKLAVLYETYNTLLDRDFIVMRKGTRFDTTYDMMPADRAPFKGKKPTLTEGDVYQMLLDAFAPDVAEKMKGKKAKPAAVAAPSKKKAAPVEEDEDEEELDEVDDDEEDEESTPPPVRKKKSAPVVEEPVARKKKPAPPVEEDEEDEEEVAPRTKAPAKAKVPAKTAKRRDPFEDDDEDED